jgi:hypothetical protein
LHKNSSLSDALGCAKIYDNLCYEVCPNMLYYLNLMFEFDILASEAGLLGKTHA